MLDIPPDDHLSALKVISGVLLIGNLEFVPTNAQNGPGVEGAAKLAVPGHLDPISNILGLNQLELLRCLTSRSFGVRSIVTCFYTVEQVNPLLKVIFIHVGCGRKRCIRKEVIFFAL